MLQSKEFEKVYSALKVLMEDLGIDLKEKERFESKLGKLSYYSLYIYKLDIYIYEDGGAGIFDSKRVWSTRLIPYLPLYIPEIDFRYETAQYSIDEIVKYFIEDLRGLLLLRKNDCRYKL